MDKWSILAYFLLAVGFFELSGRQLLAIERSGEKHIDLTTPTYYFWFSMNLSSMAVGFHFLVKLVTEVLRLEHPIKKQRRKMNVWKFLRKLWKNARAAAGPAVVASIAVGVLIWPIFCP